MDDTTKMTIKKNFFVKDSLDLVDDTLLKDYLMEQGIDTVIFPYSGGLFGDHSQVIGRLEEAHFKASMYTTPFGIMNALFNIGKGLIYLKGEVHCDANNAESLSNAKQLLQILSEYTPESIISTP